MAARRAPGVLLTGLIALAVIPPIVVVLRTSLVFDQTVTGWTFAGYNALFGDPRLYSAFWNSLRFAAAATLLSVLNGGTLAWLVERTDTPLKPLATLTALVSLGTPYIVYVTAWLYLLGRAGPVNALFRAATGASGTIVDPFSILGMVLIEGLLWSPLVFLLLSATFRNANADMEEAARMSGASVAATILRISLRLAGPAIIGVALFVFIRNLEAFDVPVLVGMPGHVELLTTGIYLDMTRAPPALSHASAFSTVLMGVVAILLAFYGRVSRHADRYASITGKAFRPRPFRLGAAGRMAGALLITLNLLIVIILPLAAIIWNSLSPFVRPMTFAALQRLTLRHYIALASQPTYLRFALNTVLISTLAAVLVMALTLLAAWLSVRRKPASGLLDTLTGLPLVIPGVVLGVALLELALNWIPLLYGTFLIISLAFVVRYMPFRMRYCSSGILQVHRELEEAAGVSGASEPQTLRRVVFPLLLPSVIAGGLFVFLLGAKELSVAVLLAGPDTETISVAMFNEWSNGASGEVAAIGVIWTTCMTVLTLGFYAASRRRGGGMVA